VAVVRDVGEVLRKHGHELAAHGVEAVGAIQGDQGHAIVALLDQYVFGHDGTSGGVVSR